MSGDLVGISSLGLYFLFGLRVKERVFSRGILRFESYFIKIMLVIVLE